MSYKQFLTVISGFFAVCFVYAQTADSFEATPEQMFAQSEEAAKRVQEIDSIISNLNNEALKEKDIKWKLCLDDVLVTSKGIVASINSAKNRMTDLINVQKIDAAKGQFVLIKGLLESAEKSLTEAYSCQKQLTKVGAKTIISKEENKEETGTYGKEDSIEEAMGIGFGDDFITLNPSVTDASENGADSAGTDSIGGPSDSPDSPGGETKIEKNSADIIKIPPNSPASPE